MGFWLGILPAWLVPWITPQFGLLQLLGMAFVLGNFFTATADDLDHMASTKGFLKTWTFIVLVVLALDMGDLLWKGYDMQRDMLPFIVKWILLLVFCTLSHEAVGAFFSIATGDVLAVASAGALLSPILIILFFVILKVADLLERPLLRKFGNGDAYPFMPVVFTAYTIMLVLGLWFGNFI
jgi:hypothetical protein